MHLQLALALIAIFEDQGNTEASLTLTNNSHAITHVTVVDLALALVHCDNPTLRNHLTTLSKTITIYHFHETQIANIPVIY